MASPARALLTPEWLTAIRDVLGEDLLLRPSAGTPGDAASEPEPELEPVEVHCISNSSSAVALSEGGSSGDDDCSCSSCPGANKPAGSSRRHPTSPLARQRFTSPARASPLACVGEGAPTWLDDGCEAHQSYRFEGYDAVLLHTAGLVHAAHARRGPTRRALVRWGGLCAEHARARSLTTCALVGLLCDAIDRWRRGVRHSSLAKVDAYTAHLAGWVGQVLRALRRWTEEVWACAVPRWWWEEDSWAEQGGFPGRGLTHAALAARASRRRARRAAWRRWLAAAAATAAAARREACAHGCFAHRARRRSWRCWLGASAGEVAARRRAELARWTAAHLAFARLRRAHAAARTDLMWALGAARHAAGRRRRRLASALAYLRHACALWSDRTVASATATAYRRQCAEIAY